MFKKNFYVKLNGIYRYKKMVLPVELCDSSFLACHFKGDKQRLYAYISAKRYVYEHFKTKDDFKKQIIADLNLDAKYRRARERKYRVSRLYRLQELIATYLYGDEPAPADLDVENIEHMAEWYEHLHDNHVTYG